MKIEYRSHQIAEIVRALGLGITNHYANDPQYRDQGLLVLGVLTGSFILLADLVREIRYPVHVDFLAAASYGDKHTSSGNVRLLYAGQQLVGGRNVLLVDDIEDSGSTLDHLIPHLRALSPRSIAICTLLRKKKVSRPDVVKQWVGFDVVPNRFFVGYGMGDGEDSRHLPDIWSVR